MPSADRDRLAPQLRIIALLDRRVKGIHVDMDDLADRLVGLGHGEKLLSYSADRSLADESRKVDRNGQRLKHSRYCEHSEHSSCSASLHGWPNLLKAHPQ